MRKYIQVVTCFLWCWTFFSLLFCDNVQPKIKISSEKIAYIIKKYEKVLYDKPHLFYPAKKAQRLVIVFAGAGARGKYNMFSWYWSNEEDWDKTAYLFLRDDEVCWYLGNDKGSFVEDFSNIIKYYIKACKLTNDKVFTLGSSMGGYAALFYATILGLKGVVAVNPQVDRASNEVTRYGISRAGKKWQDLDKVMAASATVPNVLLIYGQNLKDKAACNTLLDVLKEKAPTTIIRRHASERHGISRLIFSKELIASAIDYFEKQGPFKEDVEAKGIDFGENEDL